MRGSGGSYALRAFAEGAGESEASAAPTHIQTFANARMNSAGPARDLLDRLNGAHDARLIGTIRPLLVIYLHIPLGIARETNRGPEPATEKGGSLQTRRPR
jgi:hypothetical protein